MVADASLATCFMMTAEQLNEFVTGLNEQRVAMLEVKKAMLELKATNHELAATNRELKTALVSQAAQLVDTEQKRATDKKQADTVQNAVHVALDAKLNAIELAIATQTTSRAHQEAARIVSSYGLALTDGLQQYVSQLRRQYIVEPYADRIDRLFPLPGPSPAPAPSTSPSSSAYSSAAVIAPAPPPIPAPITNPDQSSTAPNSGSAGAAAAATDPNDPDVAGDEASQDTQGQPRDAPP